MGNQGGKSVPPFLQAWEEYALQRGAATDADRREFPYLLIRRAVKRLSKSKMMASSHRAQTADLAMAAFRELQIS